MTISLSSSKLYGKMLGYLLAAGYNNEDILNDSKEVAEYIKNLKNSISSKKLYISAILNALKEQDKPVPTIYTTMMVSLKKQANEKTESQTLTPQQKTNAMTWDEVVKTHKAYSKTVNKTDINDYKDFMILSLYVLNDPVRADYNDMRIYTKKPPKNISGNYMIWTAKAKDFIFQDYKTSPTYGKLTIRINKDLRKVIKHWLTLNTNHEWLMGDDYTASWLSLRLRIIMKRLAGKEGGINILRHARITKYLEGQKYIEEKKPLAHNMMHSNAVQEQYLVK